LHTKNCTHLGSVRMLCISTFQMLTLAYICTPSKYWGYTQRLFTEEEFITNIRGVLVPLVFIGLHLSGFYNLQRRLEGMCTLCGRKVLRLKLYKLHKNLTDRLLKNCRHRYKARRNKEALLDVILTLYLFYSVVSSSLCAWLVHFGSPFLG